MRCSANYPMTLNSIAATGVLLILSISESLQINDLALGSIERQTFLLFCRLLRVPKKTVWPHRRPIEPLFSKPRPLNQRQIAARAAGSIHDLQRSGHLNRTVRWQKSRFVKLARPKGKHRHFAVPV